MASNDKEFIATLQLARTKNIGPVTFRKLISKYEKPSLALKAVEELRPIADVEKEIEKVEKCGARFVTIFDDNYPALLREIKDAPVVLTVKGNIENLQKNNVAFVGARYASANAVSFTFKLAKDLAEKGQTVVSGLARGIDTAAHKGALANEDNKMPTIAVIAGGIDNIYPPENEKLFREISERGLIITENEFGTVPKPEHFPRRNRIISGLSQVTCVMEAALKSGSLITARFAYQQNREVACVPGFPSDPRSEGTNLLIKRGAKLISGVNDVMDLLKNYDPQEARNKNLFSENETEDLFFEEDEGEIELLSVIGNSPVAVDELVAIYGFSAADINSKLLEYELTGEIIRLPGNKVAKAA